MAEIEPYTVALTSCGRFDLLERTLESLIPNLEGPCVKIVIAEDSGDCAILDLADKFRNSGIDIETIINIPKLGQFGSIDHLYSRVETEWVFHCEDDWEFIAQGFMVKSFAILKEFDSCSMVSLLVPGSFKKADYFLPAAVAECGIEYHVANSRSGWRFVGLHFNPGLRRMRDYKIVGPYTELGSNIGESKITRAYEALGYRVICLTQPYVRHVGDGRQVFSGVRNRTRSEKIKRELVKPIKKAYWMLNPDAHPYSASKQRFETHRNNLARWRNWDDEEL